MPLTSSSQSSGQYQTLVSLATLITDARVLLRDNATNKKWSDAELTAIIGQVLAELSNIVWLEDWYESEFAGGQRDYVLPSYIEEILSIERIGGLIGITIDGETDYGPPVAILGYDHLYDPVTNIIHLKRLQPDGSTMRIRYRRRLSHLPSTGAVTDQLVATDEEDLINADTPYIYPVPGYIKIDNEVIFYSSISADGFTGLLRGVNGTAAGTHNVAATITPLLPIGPRLHHVIMNGIDYKAQEMLLHNAPSSKSNLALTLINTKRGDWEKAKRSLVGAIPGKRLENHYNSRRRRVPLLN